MVSVTTMHSNFAGIVRIHSEVLHTPVWSLATGRKLRVPGSGGDEAKMKRPGPGASLRLERPQTSDRG